MSYTPEQILTLAKAGFTAQQIAGLNAMQGGTAGQNQTSPIAQPTTPPTLPTNTDQISQMLQTLQMQNIIQASQPPVQTTNDILASIIAPPNQNQTGGNKT